MRRILSPGLLFIFTVTVIYFSSFLQEDSKQLPGFAFDPAGGFSLPLSMAGGAPPLPVPDEPAPSPPSQPLIVGEERQPSVEELEKISISYGIEKEFFTIQAASYPDVTGAERGYALLAHDLGSKELDRLRIEVVGSYHTLRLGAFENRDPAQSLLHKVKKFFPSALVLRAYIKPERIIKSYHQTQTHEEMPSGPGNISEIGNSAQDIPPTQEGAYVASSQQTGEVQSVKAESGADARQMKTSPDDMGEVGARATISVPPREEKRDIRKTSILPKNLSFKTIKILDRDDRANPLVYPAVVFYDRGMREIYVIDSGRVLIFDAEYAMLVSFGKGRGVGAPQGLYVDSNGWVYVCQAQDGDKPPRLTILNPALFVEKEILLNSIDGAESFTPERIARSHDGTLYLVGPNTRPGVLVLDSQGNFLRWLRAGDSEPGRDAAVSRKPVFIKDVDIDDQGRIYLLSEETSKIYVYSPEEKFLFSFGQKGGSSGKTSRPRGLALDSERGIIYVVDYMRHTILVYDFNGTYLSEFGGLGYSEGWFYYPTDITVDETGRPIIADFFNHRVQILEMEGHD